MDATVFLWPPTTYANFKDCNVFSTPSAGWWVFLEWLHGLQSSMMPATTYQVEDGHSVIPPTGTPLSISLPSAAHPTSHHREHTITTTAKRHTMPYYVRKGSHIGIASADIHLHKKQTPLYVLQSNTGDTQLLLSMSFLVLLVSYNVFWMIGTSYLFILYRIPIYNTYIEQSKK